MIKELLEKSKNLSFQQRCILLLREEGCSPKEIIEILGVKPQSYYRAVKGIQQIVTQQIVTQQIVEQPNVEQHNVDTKPAQRESVTAWKIDVAELEEMFPSLPV